MNRELSSGVTALGRTVCLAALAGGLAEVIWVAGYSALSGVDGWQVAREVSAAVAPAWAQLEAAPVLGLGIHLLLSFLLAGVFVAALRAPFLRRHRMATILFGGPLALAGVWAINFLVVLPMLHPAFVHLLPYPVSLGSKVLFGLAMAAVLIARASEPLKSSMGARTYPTGFA